MRKILLKFHNRRHRRRWERDEKAGLNEKREREGEEVRYESMACRRDSKFSRPGVI